MGQSLNPVSLISFPKVHVFSLFFNFVCFGAHSFDFDLKW